MSTPPPQQTDDELRESIALLKEQTEGISFENKIFEKFLYRVQGNFEIPQMSEEDYATLNLDGGGMNDIASIVGEMMFRQKNTAPSQSSKRSKTTSVSSSQGQSSAIAYMYKLSGEQKCDIVLREIEEIATEVETVKSETERVIDNYRASIEELELKQRDIAKAFSDFERDMKNSINDRTKKYQAEKVQRYFEEKKRAKEALVKKLRLKTATMGVQKKKVSLQLKQKEEMGEVLHEVDFNQLKIENQQYLEKIDDKNCELLDLKQKATNTTVHLNGKKRLMQELTENIKKMNDEVKFRKDTLKRLDGEMEKVKCEVVRAKQNLERLKNKMEDYEVPATKNYIDQKSKLDELRQKAKTWMRKVEIAEMKLKSVNNNWRVLCSKQNAQVAAGDNVVTSAAVSPKGAQTAAGGGANSNPLSHR